MTQLWALDVAVPVDPVLPPIKTPTMKLVELGEVGEVVPTTVERPPVPTHAGNRGADTCTNAVGQHRRDLRHQERHH